MEGTVIGWIAVACACCWVSWLSGAHWAESKCRRELATLGRQLERAMATICNLDDELGLMRERIAQTQANALRTMRKSAELARTVFEGARPKVDEVHILGGVDWVETQTMGLQQCGN